MLELPATFQRFFKKDGAQVQIQDQQGNLPNNEGMRRWELPEIGKQANPQRWKISSSAVPL